MAERSVIFMVSLPAHGHAPALFNLAIKLAAASPSSSIIIVNIESLHKKAVEQWIHHERIRLESLPFEFEVPRAIDSKFDRRPLMDALLKLRLPFSDLVSRYRSSGAQISCIISDYFVQWTEPVAREHGIPHVCFWPGSISWCLIEYHTPELFATKDAPDAQEEETSKDESDRGMNCFLGDAGSLSTQRAVQGASVDEKIISYIPGLKPFKQRELPFLLHQQLVEGLGIERILQRRQRLESDEWILANSFTELEPEPHLGMEKIVSSTNRKFVSVGPLRSSWDEEPILSVESGAPECIDWLEKQGVCSVLYVSFGSLATLTSQQFEELAMGLENSKKPFLWVIRPEFLKGVSQDFYEGFKERTKNRGLVVTWAPQVRVLSHMATGGFLTHCGWNSILESISYGVPMLGWPCYAEQNTNCRLFVEEKGTGFRISENKVPGGGKLVSREHIATAVVELLEGETGQHARYKVRELKDAARKAVTQGGSSQENLQQFVKSILLLRVRETSFEFS